MAPSSVGQAATQLGQLERRSEPPGQGRLAHLSQTGQALRTALAGCRSVWQSVWTSRPGDGGREWWSRRWSMEHMRAGRTHISRLPGFILPLFLSGDYGAAWTPNSRIHRQEAAQVSENTSWTRKEAHRQARWSAKRYVAVSPPRTCHACHDADRGRTLQCEKKLAKGQSTPVIAMRIPDNPRPDLDFLRRLTRHSRSPGPGRFLLGRRFFLFWRRRLVVGPDPQNRREQVADVPASIYSVRWRGGQRRRRVDGRGWELQDLQESGGEARLDVLPSMCLYARPLTR